MLPGIVISLQGGGLGRVSSNNDGTAAMVLSLSFNLCVMLLMF